MIKNFVNLIKLIVNSMAESGRFEAQAYYIASKKPIKTCCCK